MVVPASNPPRGYVSRSQFTDLLGIGLSNFKKIFAGKETKYNKKFREFLNPLFKGSYRDGPYVYFKKPTKQQIKKVKEFFGRTTISQDLVDDIKALHNSSFIQVLSSGELEAIKKINSDWKCHLISNGIYMPPKKDFKLKPYPKSWNDKIPKNANVLLFLGRFHKKKGINELKKASKSFPNGSGVYKFMGCHNEPLYVGKAKNLKKRISSYLDENRQNRRIKTLISLTNSLNFIKTPNEVDSLILENNHIIFRAFIDNIADNFRISGLGQLIEAGIQADRFITFGD